MTPPNKYHLGIGRKTLADRSEGRRIAEAIRGEYERQVTEIASDDWLRLLAVAGLAHHEMYGSKSKDEKFLSKLAGMLEAVKRDKVKTDWLVAELEKRTGIELEVRDNIC